MPASTKYSWDDLLTAARRVRATVGRRPSVSAVAKAVGGGDPRRIELVITAVEIEHGHHVHLLDSLPPELQKLVKDPRPEGGPPPEGAANGELPAGVRDGLAQAAAACAVALQHARVAAEARVVEAAASAAAIVEDMHRRLLEQEQDAEVARREHAEVTTDYERRVGALSTALATVEQELGSRARELERAQADLERARETEHEARAHRDRTLDAHHALAERSTADLASATARAVGAAAERDAVQQLAARLESELHATRAAHDATVARLSAEIESLRGELAAARLAQHAAVAAGAASEARLAEVRMDRDRLVAAAGR